MSQEAWPSSGPPVVSPNSTTSTTPENLPPAASDFRDRLTRGGLRAPAQPPPDYTVSPPALDAPPHPHILPLPRQMQHLHYSSSSSGTPPGAMSTVASSASPASVADFLAAINLSEYYEAHVPHISFIDEGFDRMSSVIEITEEDLVALAVKRGHRRTIQRQIAMFRGLPYMHTLMAPRQSDGVTEFQIGDGADSGAFGGLSSRSGDSSQQTRDGRVEPGQIIQSNSNVIVFRGKAAAKNLDDVTLETGKRRYRRHPKPDLNAPEKPPSAYVTFSNAVREELKGTKSFSELARIVGENWKTLDPAKKEQLEAVAAQHKEQYHHALAKYRSTPSHAAYQQYLADFKRRHGQHDVKPPRSRSRHHTGGAERRKRSPAVIDHTVMGEYTDESSSASGTDQVTSEAASAQDIATKRQRTESSSATMSPSMRASSLGISQPPPPPLPSSSFPRALPPNAMPTPPSGPVASVQAVSDSRSTPGPALLHRRRS